MEPIQRQAPAWVRPLIGIPWVDGGREIGGCDCWGLVRLGIWLRSGLWVKSYSADYDSAVDRTVAELIEREAEGGEWESIDTPRELDVGERRIVRQLFPTDNFLTAQANEVRFGLGTAQTVDRLIVHWPSGTVQKFDDVPVGVHLRITEDRDRFDVLLRTD